MTSLDDDVPFSEFCKINSENTQWMVLKHATFYTCIIFIERQCENIRSKRCKAHDYTAFANYRLFQYYVILSWNIFKEIQITQLPDIITRHH